MRSGLAIAFCTLLIGCSPTDLDQYARKHTTDVERAFANRFLSLIAHGQHDSAMSLLDRELDASAARNAMSAVESVLATTKLDSMHFIGLNINTTLGGTQALRSVNLTFEAPTITAWMYGNVAMSVADGSPTVVGFSAYQIPDRLETLNRFSFVNRSWRHYLFLVLAIGMLVVTLGMAVYVVRSRIKYRWLWALLALVASPAFAINWTTGQSTIQSSLFILFGVAFARASSAAPWTLSFGLPVGAIVAYFKVRAARASVQPPSSNSPVAA